MYANQHGEGNGRDAESPPIFERRARRRGRNLIAVIGIDRYNGQWPLLHNAVSDASGALDLFVQLGFEQVAALMDGAATGDAMRRLVTDDLSVLGPDDSLVLFFAGHGFTRTNTFQQMTVKTGYLIPVDGLPPTRGTATWVRLDAWLSDVARLPAKHILVILDACHSGIALGSLIKWRGVASEEDSLEQLSLRRSRRIITSALEEQQALDNGPVSGHSLFTGCLIEALTGGLARTRKRVVTGSELGLYVQQRVSTYPGARQTPDFGALELDDRGEILLRLPTVSPEPPGDSRPPASSCRRRARFSRPIVGCSAFTALAVYANAQLVAPSAFAEIERRNPFVEVAGIRMQVHQVTRKEYALYLGTLDPERSRAAGPRFDADLDHPHAPVSSTTYEQATRFCAALSARLPSSAEWEGASGGTWGIKLEGAGTRGPLREWTSTFAENDPYLVRIRGASEAMSRSMSAGELDKLVRRDRFKITEEGVRQAGQMSKNRDDDPATAPDLGFRCVR